MMRASGGVTRVWLRGKGRGRLESSSTLNTSHYASLSLIHLSPSSSYPRVPPPVLSTASWLWHLCVTPR
ncbi:hypothetical protein E2C01_039162 [Portunus trituberculatus]|uniref:Uncharacterized protein n=1 Tax=Portunus trituberculatus TaxID=210409 RepID=A0A5B7FJZ9_PORTR|nr:hypothetical protein [Portunus trituberculatus]